MDEIYKVLATVPDVELVQPNKTRPVRVVSARAIPSDVVFFFTVVKADFAPSHINLIAHDIALALNRDAKVAGVEAIEIGENINASLQRFPSATVTVSSTDGNLEDEITVPYGELFDDRFDKRVAAARANLDAIAEL
jgi:hypothetical protein